MFVYTKMDMILFPFLFWLFCWFGTGLSLLLKGTKWQSMPFRIMAVFLLVLEIAKQIWCICDGYSLYNLPLHFCSLFTPLFFLSQFSKPKCSKIFKPLAFVYSGMVTVLMCVNPHAMIGNASSEIFTRFLSFHTFSFHFTVAAYFVFSIFFCDYIPKIKDFLNVCCGVIVYATYAIPCAYVLNANYLNILYNIWEPFDNFRIRYGQVVYDISLFVVGMIGASALFFVYCFFFGLYQKQNSKRQVLTSKEKSKRKKENDFEM